MLAIGCPSQQIGKEYFNKLLGVTNGIAKMATTTRIAKICHKCRIDMTPNGPTADRAAGLPLRSGEPGRRRALETNHHRSTSAIAMPAISRGEPASTTEAGGESKANAVKSAVVKAAVVKTAAAAGAQSWVEQQEEGEEKASRRDSASGCAGKLGINCGAAKQMLDKAGGGDKLPRRPCRRCPPPRSEGAGRAAISICSGPVPAGSGSI
jgi:hypothetical protein